MGLSAAQRRLGGQGRLQIVDIVVANGYHPSVVEARAGVPLRLVFRRLDAHECSDRVVFSEPRLIRHLAPGADTIIDLPAAGPGDARFTCGMGRYRGRIEWRTEPGAGGGGIRGRGAWPWLLMTALLTLLLMASIAADAPVLVTWIAVMTTSLAVAVFILRAAALLPRAHGRR